MATKLGCLTLNQLQKQVSQSQTQKNLKTSWMWNPSDNNNSSSSNNQPRGEEDDDSWEVRAFAEDTGNIMGTTWPPRSYTCSFCRREFRSAQALGGHMNVHRRDRARLHQTQNGSSKNPISGCAAAPISSSPTFIIPPPEVATNGGLCLFYQLSSSNNPNCNAMFAPSSMYLDSPSTLLSINSYPSSTLLSSLPNYQDTTTMMPSSSPHCYSIKPKATDAIDSSGHDNINDQKMIKRESSSSEDLDLELRLGHGPVAS